MAESALQVVDRPAPLVRQTLEPNTLQEAIEFSKIVADSELAPKDFRGKSANVLVAIQMGKELGVPPLQALQGIAVINGRPTVWGDLMWALVTSHPSFEDAIEEVNDTQAKVTLKRRGRSPVTVIFSQADAVKAGLWGKAGPWTQYPKRQMLWRARTFAARDLFPDALKGMISAEEASDYDGPTIDSASIQQQAQPAQQAAPPEETVGIDGGNAFYKAYKAAGWTPAEATAWLKDILGIEAPKNSKDIPKSKFQQAMEWANTKAPIRVKVEGAFDVLDWTLEERQKLVAEMKVDWVKIDEHLSREIDKKNQAQ